jgi:hypothetical protein
MKIGEITVAYRDLTNIELIVQLREAACVWFNDYQLRLLDELISRYWLVIQDAKVAKSRMLENDQNPKSSWMVYHVMAFAHYNSMENKCQIDVKMIIIGNGASSIILRIKKEYVKGNILTIGVIEMRDYPIDQ